MRSGANSVIIGFKVSQTHRPSGSPTRWSSKCRGSSRVWPLPGLTSSRWFRVTPTPHLCCSPVRRPALSRKSVHVRWARTLGCPSGADWRRGLSCFPMWGFGCHLRGARPSRTPVPSSSASQGGELQLPRCSRSRSPLAGWLRRHGVRGDAGCRRPKSTFPIGCFPSVQHYLRAVEWGFLSEVIFEKVSLCKLLWRNIV